jgi:hypothetical protein
MREHRVVVLQGGGEDVRGSAFSGCRKKVKKPYFFCVILECGGCHY